MRRLAWVLGIVILFSCGTLKALAQEGRAPAGQEEYVPISELDDVEQLPAAPLVIGAYAVIWVGVFAYLWTIWRRLSTLDGELATLRRRLAERGPHDSRRV